MKIFLNLLAGTTGGQVTRSKALLDRLIINNSGIKVFLVKDNKILNEYQSNPNIEIININIGNGKFKILKRIYWETFFMPGILHKSKADIFISFSHFLPFRKFNISTFVGVSNLAPFSSIALKEESFLMKMKFKLLRLSILSSLSRATAVMALSHTAKNVLIKHGVPPKKIVVIPIGVEKFWSNQSEIQRVINEIGITNPFYLYVSHFYRYKNHLRLIEAYSNLPFKILNQNILVLVGKFENINYINQIKQLIASKNLEDKVILLPGQNSYTLRALYQSTKLFIFPSLVENCPNILLEAMASGAPVVSINIEPMTEYCQEAAIYFDGMKVSDISRAIYDVSANPSLLNSMRILSKQRASNYSWDQFVNILIEEIKIIISSSIKKNI